MMPRDKLVLAMTAEARRKLYDARLWPIEWGALADVALAAIEITDEDRKMAGAALAKYRWHTGLARTSGTKIPEDEWCEGAAAVVLECFLARLGRTA